MCIEIVPAGEGALEGNKGIRVGKVGADNRTGCPP